MREEIVHLREATKAATKRKSCKQRYIVVDETLTVSAVANLIAAREGGGCDNSKEPARRVRAARRCSYCGEIGHNSRTCTKEIDSSEDSNKSK